MAKFLLVPFIFGILLLPQAALADISVTVDVVPPPPAIPIYKTIFNLIPLAMSAGGIFFLAASLIGSPKTPKELIDTAIATTIIFLFLVASISVIAGLI